MFPQDLYLGTQMKVAEKNGCLRARDEQNDEDKEEKSKHVVRLMSPVSI